MNISFQQKMIILFVNIAILLESSEFFSAKIAFLYKINITSKGIETIILMLFLLISVPLFFSSIEKLGEKTNKVVRDNQKRCKNINKSDITFYAPPGSIYISIAKIILTKKAYSQIMEPSILMMQEEYFEYSHNGDKYFAVWTKVRFFFVFLFVLGLSLPFIKQLIEIKSKIAK